MSQSYAFAGALTLLRLKSANKIAREGWNGKGMFVFQIEDWKYTNGFADNFENLPFLALKTADNKVAPWLPSQTDILATDWTVVE